MPSPASAAPAAALPAPAAACGAPTAAWGRRRLLWAAAGTVLAAAAGAGGYAWLRPQRGGLALPEGEVCIVAPPTPYNAALGQPLQAARDVPADARCPVCGMFPARSLEWAAQLIFANGDAHFFDSPLSLFQYLHDLPRYSPGRHKADIVAIYTTDVTSRAWTDARSAFYVHGSNALGPMRAGNLPAFARREEAHAFAQRRGGQVLAWSAVTPAVIAPLAVPHRHAP